MPVNCPSTIWTSPITFECCHIRGRQLTKLYVRSPGELCFMAGDVTLPHLAIGLQGVLTSSGGAVAGAVFNITVFVTASKADLWVSYRERGGPHFGSSNRWRYRGDVVSASRRSSAVERFQWTSGDWRTPG